MCAPAVLARPHRAPPTRHAPGDALAHVEAAGLGPKVIPLVQVFARVSPEQKESILKTLRARGFTTLMVGDGTNDVGALKAAHVGVALLAAPPAAPPAGAGRIGGEKKKAKKSAGGEGGSGEGGDKKAVVAKGKGELHARGGAAVSC